MYCNSKAVYNLKHVDGKADLHGPVVQLGAEEKYFPTCFKCYRQQILDVNTNFLDLVWSLFWCNVIALALVVAAVFLAGMSCILNDIFSVN